MDVGIFQYGGLDSCDIMKAKYSIITHAPLFREDEDYVCELPFGHSSLVMNIHKPFMHCVMSHYVFKQHDVIMLLHAVTIVTT